MGFFNKVSNFFQKPAVRLGLAAGSALGGMGAFDSFNTSKADGSGVDWGKHLTTGFGVGNLGSAAVSQDAWSIPQAGLGAYGVLQNNKVGGVGNFGTYGQSYDRVMNAPKGFGSGASAFIGGQPPQAANDTRYSLLTPEKWGSASNTNNLPSPQVTARLDEEGDIIYNGPSLTPVAVGRQQLEAFPGGKYDANYNAGVSNTTAPAPAKLANTSPLALQSKWNPNYANSLDYSMDIAENEASLAKAPSSPFFVNAKLEPEAVQDYTQQVKNVLTSGGPEAAATLKSDANTQKAASFSFEGMMEKALDKALESPMETFSVAAAVMAAFTDNRDEIAASTYANEMANYNKRLDPSSNFAAEWQTTYIQDKNDELNKQFAKAEADLIATMSRRGMTDSSVNSAAMSSLTSAKAELAAKFKQDAMMAYSQYQGGLIRTQIAATTGAVNAAKMASGVGGVNYQNTFKAATAAIA